MTTPMRNHSNKPRSHRGSCSSSCLILWCLQFRTYNPLPRIPTRKNIPHPCCFAIVPLLRMTWFLLLLVWYQHGNASISQITCVDAFAVVQRESTSRIWDTHDKTIQERNNFFPNRSVPIGSKLCHSTSNMDVRKYSSNLSDSEYYSSNHDRIPKNVKLLILPGFGNAMDDYILSATTTTSPTVQPSATSTTTTTSMMKTGSLLQSLLNRGWQYNENVFVLPLQRIEWIKVFVYGLFDPQFVLYSNAPPTNPAFGWYLQRIQTTIQNQMVPTKKKQIDHQRDNRNINLTTTNNPNTTTSAARTEETTEIPTQIILIGHSAGGWLGRAAIAYVLQQQERLSSSSSAAAAFVIAGMVTLGTPNLPPPITEMDMTRGALRFTHAQYPGAYQHYDDYQQHDIPTDAKLSLVSESQPIHSDTAATTTTANEISRNSTTTTASKETPSLSNDTTGTTRSPLNQTTVKKRIFYITVCGNAVQGMKLDPPATTGTSTAATDFAYNSYQVVCGNGTEIGDGVVPICAAHLHNADVQITLPNAYHSMNVPDQWYGSDTVIDTWYHPMMEEINQMHVVNNSINCQ
jgi:hypothetical protein